MACCKCCCEGKTPAGKCCGSPASCCESPRVCCAPNNETNGAQAVCCQAGQTCCGGECCAQGNKCCDGQACCTQNQICCGFNCCEPDQCCVGGECVQCECDPPCSSLACKECVETSPGNYSCSSTCEAGQCCVDGNCTTCPPTTCPETACGEGECCVDGYCVTCPPTDCPDDPCPEGECCMGGVCETCTPCEPGECGEGLCCVDGYCVDCPPPECPDSACPEGECCVDGYCTECLFCVGCNELTPNDDVRCPSTDTTPDEPPCTYSSDVVVPCACSGGNVFIDSCGSQEFRDYVSEEFHSCSCAAVSSYCATYEQIGTGEAGFCTCERHTYYFHYRYFIFVFNFNSCQWEKYSETSNISESPCTGAGEGCECPEIRPCIAPDCGPLGGCVCDNEFP